LNSSALPSEFYLRINWQGQCSLILGLLSGRLLDHGRLGRGLCRDMRGRCGLDGKLVDNFSHESDVTSLQDPFHVTSLQDPFMSRPYKTPFYFYYCVPRKIPRGILFQIHVEYSPFSRLLVSALAVYATAFKDYVSLVMSPCSTAVFALDCFSHWTTTSAVRLFYRTGNSLLQTLQT